MAYKVEQSSIELTNGERLVGKTFNPSGDDKVAKAKELCAELADMIYSSKQESFEYGTLTALKEQLADRALMDILAAQMMVVKTLTINK